MKKEPAKKTIVLILSAVLIFIAGCNIFNDADKNSEDSSGWKKSSFPKMLSGKWYYNGVYDIKITSTMITTDNREWVASTIETNGEEYRVVARSDYQYRAFYFRNITITSAEKSLSLIAYTSYEAKKADKTSWVLITK
ncbi:hypothetical protein ACFL1R_10920 [Candidatus Latescibacterota bacterium]